LEFALSSLAVTSDE
jgi:hypothetical protein